MHMPGNYGDEHKMHLNFQNHDFQKHFISSSYPDLFQFTSIIELLLLNKTDWAHDQVSTHPSQIHNQKKEIQPNVLTCSEYSWIEIKSTSQLSAG